MKVPSVAVTVRTATFYTRTKIRKLDTPSTDPHIITAMPTVTINLCMPRPVVHPKQWSSTSK